MSFPQITDDEDVIIEQLRRLNRNLEQQTGTTIGSDGTTVNSGGTTVNSGGRTVNIDQDVTREQGSNATYWSSGPSGFLAPSDEWEDISFGFEAATVNVRTSTDLLIAFQKPYSDQSQVIPIATPDDSPFTIGGARPLGATKIWVKAAANTDTEPLVHIIAQK